MDESQLLPRLADRAAYFRYLNGLAVDAVTKGERKEKNQARTSVKSYLLELDRHGLEPVRALNAVIKPEQLRSEQVDEELVRLRNADGQYSALIEFLDDRFALAYTLLDVNVSDALFTRLARNSAEMDQAWLTADFFRTEWNRVRRVASPHRYVKFGFEYRAQYESDEAYLPHLGDDDEEESSMAEDSAIELDEHRTSRFYLTERIAKVNSVLPKFEFYDPLRSITLLRVPASVRGGHDVYFNGKITNRSESFDDHRLHARFLLSSYANLTRSVEKNAWLRFEQDETSVFGPKLRGVPVVHKFRQPLAEDTFGRWIDALRKRNNRFRLHGYLRKLSDRKYHFIGVDRHMWQTINLELTPRHVVALLPDGTCGNIINRLAANLQRFIDPAVETFVGSKKYADLVEQAFDGNNK